jgi:MFS family permease
MHRLSTVAVRALAANIRKCFYIRIFAQSLAFCVATIVVLWKSLGLSQAEVFLLEGLFAFTVALCQLPTGLFADRLGRKWAMVGASLIMCLGCVMYLFADGFYTLLLSETLLGFGLACLSGADEALLYDSMVQLRKKDRFPVLWGQALSWGFLMSATGCALGAVLASYHLRAPFVMALLGSIAMAVVSLTLTEPERAKRHEVQLSLSGIRMVLLSQLVKRPQVMWVCLYGAMTFALLQVSILIYPVYFKAAGFPIWAFGLIFAGYNLTACLAGRTVRMILRGRNYGREVEMQCFAGLALLLCLSYLAFGAGVWMLGVLFGIGHQVVRAVMPVLVSSSMNREIDETYRASVLSVKGTVDAFVYGTALLVFAGCSGGMEVCEMLNVTGIVVAVVLGAMLYMRPIHRAVA